MRTTLKDIARIAGVSVPCVSNIINGKTAEYSAATVERVRRIAREKNYRANALAKGMATKCTKMIGLILPDITNPYYPEIAKGVEDKASELGYTTICVNTNEDPVREREALQILEDKMVDGVVIAPSVNSRDNEEVLEQFSYPIVSVDWNCFSKGICGSVAADDYIASSAVVNHLVENGCDKVLYLSGNRNFGFTTTEAFEKFCEKKEVDKYIPAEYFARERGFFGSMRRSGRTVSRDYYKIGKYEPAFGYQAVREFLSRGLPLDAVYAGGDQIAIGVMQALKEKGLCIPEDVAVVGYDNINFSQYLEPALTTVHQPKYEMGQKGVEMLIRIINRRNEKEKDRKEEVEKIIMEPTLIVRKSSVRKNK